MLNNSGNYKIAIDENGPYTRINSADPLNYNERIEGTFVLETQLDSKIEIPYRKVNLADIIASINEHKTEPSVHVPDCNISP